MLILGIHGGHKRDFEDNGAGYGLHDGAAVLLRDSEVVAGIEEERLNRIKHSNFFPYESLKFCLGQARVELEEVDRIALNHNQQTFDMIARNRLLVDLNESFLDGRSMMGAMFRDAFGVDIASKIRFCHHHIAHAASAFFASGFQDSLIVTLDGDGDGLCGLVLVNEGGSFRPLREYPMKHSLGDWYSLVIKILGYDRFDEYKVMGLAPHGDPEVYRGLFRQLYRLMPQGVYELATREQHLGLFLQAGLLQKIRRKGEPFSQVHKDFAAALQASLEEIVLHIVSHYQRETRQKRLCLAGGVVHNCSMNGRILETGLFEEVFAQPAAHDAGTALGAAWTVLYEETGVRCSPMTHVFWGSDVGEAEAIRRELEVWSDFLEVEQVDDIMARAAQLIAEGAVLGWVQGRSEFGPRALGNRSILADPRPARNKDRVNQMVKKREGYRPFAPSVREEDAADFFELPAGGTQYQFMIFVVKVKEEMRERLAAITHVDGTARIQTVSRHTNPRFWQLLGEFKKLTGIPILLNTSFNNNAEPIVDSVDDAVACFLTTGLDYLVVGDYLASKREKELPVPLCLGLVPTLRPSRKLVKRLGQRGGGEKYFIESTASRYFGEDRIEVSLSLFQALTNVDGRRSLLELLREQGVADDSIQSAGHEAVDLWMRRVLVLRPAAP